MTLREGRRGGRRKKRRGSGNARRLQEVILVLSSLPPSLPSFLPSLPTYASPWAARHQMGWRRPRSQSEPGPRPRGCCPWWGREGGREGGREEREGKEEGLAFWCSHASVILPLPPSLPSFLLPFLPPSLPPSLPAAAPSRTLERITPKAKQRRPVPGG